MVPPPPLPGRRAALPTLAIEPDFAVGDIVDDRYELLELVSNGNFGVVFRAEQRITQRVVALKLLHPWLGDDPGLVERTAREARFAGSIRHPNIVEIIDAGQTSSGHPFIAMEHLIGWTLREHLRRNSRLTIDATAGIFMPIVAAIAAAHGVGVVHRDLKPNNIVLIEGEHGPIPKVVDFGLAGAVATANERERLTAVGTVLGTFEYMAPEQAIGAPVHPSCDIYALGVVLHELLTGELPFTGENDAALMQAKMVGLLDERPMLYARVPEPWRELVQRCLAHDPQRRPTALQLHRELQLLVAVPRPTDAPVRSATRARGIAIAVGFTLGGLAALIAACG
jgi:serine/threonine-protein kinase